MRPPFVFLRPEGCGPVRAAQDLRLEVERRREQRERDGAEDLRGDPRLTSGEKVGREGCAGEARVRRASGGTIGQVIVNRRTGGGGVQR